MARPKTDKIRTTIFVKPGVPSALDDIARREAVKRKQNFTRTDLINEVIEKYIKKWEKDNGEKLLKEETE